MSEKSLTLRLALFAAIVAISAVPLFGQACGSVIETITDHSSAAVVGATVTLTDVGKGERHQSKSGAGGDYQFLNLVPGIYRVEVEQSGFKKAARENVHVTVSGSVRADISMQLGEVTQTLEVQATALLLQTENASLSQVVPTRAVEELPVNGRNIIIPGREDVLPGDRVPTGHALRHHARDQRCEVHNQIGGGVANQEATHYDGVPANSALGNLVNLAPSPDSISEFRVRAGLAVATDQTARVDVNLKVGTVGATVEVVAQAGQIQADSSAVTNATDAQIINDVPNVRQNPLFYAILQNGLQPRNETSTSTLGDL